MNSTSASSGKVEASQEHPYNYPRAKIAPFVHVPMNKKKGGMKPINPIEENKRTSGS